MFLQMLRVVTLCVAAIAAPCQAAESYDNCTGFIDTVPATITTQGTWCLRHDLSTAITAGEAINVVANNVTIDCNDFKIGGLAGGTGTYASGIYFDRGLNTTVRNCNVRGFAVGIITALGGGHLIEHNRVDSNTRYGIMVYSPGSTIRSNRVIDTGGSTTDTGFAYGIYASDGVDVIDNTISGVAGTPNGSGNATAYGIYTYSNGDASVAGNRIRGLAASGSGTIYGIYNASPARLIMRNNDVQGSGAAFSVGVHCSNNQTTARDNIVAGFATGILNCLSSGDTVNTN